ncbi:transglutaminase family protein [Rhodophyticola sp. CCM32]|uniref:transglutaminase family protein n=1 Tax=Rhodophyticola sp. CCM32 TaxID=2916397 RepID=UPI00107F9BBD|nr:transglutaminase family protein [Rhodophyticola sp. CCM32]QBX99727.1 transglutaminase family protein [Rhodophyticola sp. CCM32]
MRLNIHHTTTYHFDHPTAYGLQQLRLIPKSRPGQDVLTWQMEIEGGTEQTRFTDHHQNQVSLISFDDSATSIVVRCIGDVDTHDQGGVIGKHGGFAPLWLFERATDLTRAGNHVRQLIRGLKDEYDADIPRLHALSARISEAVRYEIGATGAETTAEEAIEIGCGVCQDHAHIFIAAARAMGYPARYVSGYLMMDDRVHQDASHAWAEVHVAPLGWVGFDISNGISPDPRYVRVATGLDYAEAAPISGLRYGKAGEAMMVDIQVQQQ